jgi:hypothetical protein
MEFPVGLAVGPVPGSIGAGTIDEQAINRTAGGKGPWWMDGIPVEGSKERPRIGSMMESVEWRPVDQWVKGP